MQGLVLNVIIHFEPAEDVSGLRGTLIGWIPHWSIFQFLMHVLAEDHCVVFQLTLRVVEQLALCVTYEILLWSSVNLSACDGSLSCQIMSAWSIWNGFILVYIALPTEWCTRLDTSHPAVAPIVPSIGDYGVQHSWTWHCEHLRHLRNESKWLPLQVWSFTLSLISTSCYLHSTLPLYFLMILILK